MERNAYPSLRTEVTRGPEENQIEFHSLHSIPPKKSTKEKQKVGEKKAEREKDK